jgi:predicted phosphodiesterase
MKIAALGDIHGNYRALISVLEHLASWEPDLVLVLGDIINRGPRSKDCLELILDQAQKPDWQVIKGNHEDYVVDFAQHDYSPDSHDFALREVIHYTYKSLTSDQMLTVRDMPDDIFLQFSGPGIVRASHASTAGNRVGIYPDTSEGDLPELIPTDSRLFLVGHTHQPLVRNYQDTLVVNVGSVGLPFDGNTRSGYAQLTYWQGEWQGEIIRLDYDIQAAEKDFYDSGFIPAGGPLAELILAELRLGWPQLGRWFKRYDQPVRQNQISIQDAVYEFLKNPNIEEH